MPSPFPGMDPYLESPRLWPGLHHRLITYAADMLTPRIRPTYHARIGERVYLVDAQHTIYPDISLVEHTGPQVLKEKQADYVISRPSIISPNATVPFIVSVPAEERREPYIEIVHNKSGNVITVMEILSPANKAGGSGRNLYLQKQNNILDSQTHFVEIDLLGYGQHTLAVPKQSLSSISDYRYLICVSRANNRQQFEVYPVKLSEPLPRLQIPLKEEDLDVVLDLPAVFTQSYDNGGYVDFVDYTQPLPIPLSKEEVGWFTQFREENIRNKLPVPAMR